MRLRTSETASATDVLLNIKTFSQQTFSIILPHVVNTKLRGLMRLKIILQLYEEILFRFFIQQISISFHPFGMFEDHAQDRDKRKRNNGTYCTPNCGKNDDPKNSNERI